MLPARLSRVRSGLTLDALERRAGRHPVTLGRYDLTLLVVRSVRRVVEVRITGLAAEMTYYAIISLLPLLTAVGAGLGFLQDVVGRERVADIESAVVTALGTVFEPELTANVLAPLVQGLLREQRTGAAIGSLLVALWLASRMFRAAIRALDDAYTVPERRGLLAQVALGLALALGAVATTVVLLAMVVVGPLLGGGQALVDAWGHEETFDLVWGALRWPAVGLVCVGFLVLLHRAGPNVDITWRECLPGAVVAAVLLVGVATAFRTYLEVAGPAAPEIGRPGEAVAVAAQTLGAALATALWMWLSSIVVLVGGVLNAELERMRAEADPGGPEGRRRRRRRAEAEASPDPRVTVQ